MLIILHGWMQSSDDWGEILSKFPEGEAKVWDLPGFGREPLLSSDWTIPDYAKWVGNKIEQEKLDQIVLLGHSFGGRIAGYLASQNPEWLSGLILYAAPCLYRPSFLIRSRIALSKTVKVLFPKTKNPIQNNSELAESDKKGYGNIFRNAVSFDQTEFLPKINIPTLILWGEKDNVARPGIGEEMNSLIPGSKLEILPKNGHNAHIESPNLFYGKIKLFLEGLK